MHLACKSGNIDLVKYIISLNKIDIKSKNIFLCLLLCVMFQTFLCFLFNFNSFDFYGILKSIWSYNTILHLACESGNIDIVKYIVSFNEIDITTKNVFYSFVCFWCFHKKKIFIIFQKVTTFYGIWDQNLFLKLLLTLPMISVMKKLCKS